MNSNKTAVTVMADLVPQPTVPLSACLVVMHGENLGERHALSRTEGTLIGRSSKATIQIDQESVSRNHAEIRCEREAFIIADLQSTNGTHVNDSPIQGPTALRDGDFVKIGQTIFKFLSSSSIEQSYHEAIYELLKKDGLTQVYNKRYFLETLEREISRGQRYGRPLGLVMFDLDHFKQINDRYGHLAGDHVLKQVAQVALSHVRRDDVLARYGGEEFAIVLPEVELVGGVRLADKLRALIEATLFTFDDTQIAVTISAGVAALSAGINDAPVLASDFIRRADENLYRAKRAGRNRVVGEP